MPFVGLKASTRERINIFLVDDPRKQVDKADLVCPLCQQPMTVVAGLVRLKHFRHLIKCSNEIPKHPESVKHLLGKAYVYTTLRDVYPEDAVDFEVAIPEANRIADVLLTLDGGWRVAHEVQLASITTQELLERTRSYNEAGIDVIWWLGGEAETATNRDWIADRFGEVRTLYFQRESEMSEGFLDR